MKLVACIHKYFHNRSELAGRWSLVAKYQKKLETTQIFKQVLGASFSSAPIADSGLAIWIAKHEKRIECSSYWLLKLINLKLNIRDFIGAQQTYPSH